MRTLIVSDLHLGSATQVDVLRRPEPRAALFEALADVDRLILLGDVLELRHGPRREALAGARAFFEDLGRVFADREVVITAGNHDHALVEPWLAARGELAGGELGGSESMEPEPLELEQLFAAAEASPMLAAIADWAAPARVSVVYPGLWVRPDVYVTHGHFLDCHLTIPTMERIGIGAMSRMLHRPAESFTAVDDYEAVTAPVFAWIDAVAQQRSTGSTLNGATTVRAWQTLRKGSGRRGRGNNGRGGVRLSNGEGGGTGRGGRGRDLATALGTALSARALASAFPLAVGALNRAGLGPLRAEISTTELRQAGLRAMGEVATRLGLGEAYVIFGHTHRAGPLPGDDEAEWRGAGGARLMNSGCWSYDGYFLTAKPGESPYWPGGCVLVEDEGPPVLRRLLEDFSHEVLGPPGS